MVDGGGLPWEELADAHERAADARRRMDLAGADLAAFKRAELDWLEADADVRWAADRVGWLGALLFHAATGSVPGAGWLWEHPYLTRPSVGRFLDFAGVADDLARLDRLDEAVEWAVAEVRRVRHENWELARTVARLEREVETLRFEAERHGDHGPGEGGDGRERQAG